MQPTSLAVTSTAPGADARAAPAAPALTLAADTRSVMWPIVSSDIGFVLAVSDGGVVGAFELDHSIVHVVAYCLT
jgi:hypothetical protein